MALYLFIDTNIYLGLFSQTRDKVEELREILELVRCGEVHLYVTAAVIDEFTRNRESKISASIRELSNGKLAPPSIPRFLVDHEAAIELREAFYALEAARTKLVESASADAKLGLAADDVVQDLFAAATLLPHDDRIIARAQRRTVLRNPPGKGDSLGDRLNWEHLLDCASSSRSLNIISQDSDFASTLDSSKAASFLSGEWRDKSLGGDLVLFKTMRAFLEFAQQVNSEDVEPQPPDAKPNEDIVSILVEWDGRNESSSREADLGRFVDSFVESGAFATTHTAVANLHPRVSHLSADERTRILEAAESNNQISWIVSDDDVRSFLRDVVSAQQNVMAPDEYEQWWQRLSE